MRRGAWKLVINGMVADGTPQGREKLQGEDGLFLSKLEEGIGETRPRRRDSPALDAELEHLSRASGCRLSTAVAQIHLNARTAGDERVEEAVSSEVGM